MPVLGLSVAVWIYTTETDGADLSRHIGTAAVLPRVRKNISPSPRVAQEQPQLQVVALDCTLYCLEMNAFRP